MRFTAVEEALVHLETTAEPQNVHLELSVDGALDLDRLREAAASALERHAKARARRVPWRWRDAGFAWEVPAKPERDPVSVVDCATEADAAEARHSALSVPIALESSPAMRVVLLRRDGRESVLFSCHHAVTDAIGLLRFARAVAAAYGDLPDSEDAPPDAPSASGDDGSRLRQARSLGRVVRHAATPPARIALDGAIDAPGFRTHAMTLPIADARPRPGSRSAGVTVNDVLMSAFQLAIDGWNSEHGRSSGRIGIMLPVNLRPADRRDELVGNLWLAVVVSTTPKERADPASALHAIARQTAQAKQDADAHTLHKLLGSGLPAPLWAKQLLPAVHPLTRDRFVDTAVLSNLGSVPPLAFGDAAVTEVSFSPPARMPKGLSVGCATTGDVLNVTLRYCPAMWDDAAARRFAERFRAAIEAVASSTT